MRGKWLISGLLSVSMLFSSVAPVFAETTPVESDIETQVEESVSTVSEEAVPYEESDDTVSEIILPSEDSSLEVWYNFNESSIDLDKDGNYIIHNAAPTSTVGEAVLKNGAEAFGSFENGPDGKGILYLAGGNANTESPYLKMANDIASNITGDYTISMMVKRAGDCPLGSWIMSISKGASNQPFFFIAPNGNMIIDRFGNNKGNAGISGSTAVPSDKWVNVSLTYSKELQLMTAYIEGEEVKTAAVSNDYLLRNLFSNNDANYLGKSVWADPYFKGWIADFRLYSRELGADEIAAIQTTAQEFEDTTGNIASDAWSAVGADKNSLTINGVSELYTSMLLTTKGENGSKITWSSSDEAAMTIENTDDGMAAVAHPGADEVSVTLTAEISYGGLMVKKSFPITILAEKSADEIIPLDEEYISKLAIEPYEETDDEIIYRLPLKSMYGSTVAWDFADDYNNEYNDVIESLNQEYAELKVNLAANGYMPRELYLKAELSYEDEAGDTATGSVDSIYVDVTPKKSVNLGGRAFSYQQINNEELAQGSFEVVNNQIKVYGYSNDLWTAPDSCGYLYTKSTDENMSITVKLDQLDGYSNARRYGIMFRQSTEPSEKMVLFAIGTGNIGLQFGTRTGITGGARSLYQDPAIRSGYLRLEKAGSYYTAYYSADGINFTNIYEKKVGVPFEGEYLAGIVTATNEGAGYFSEFEVNGEDIFVSNDITDVKATASNGKINVSWTDPTEKNTRSFEKIVVTCTEKNNSEATAKVIEVEKGVGQAEIDGLENGKEYEISVQAKTAALRKKAVPSGLSTYYAWSTPITLTASPADLDSITEAAVNISGGSASRGKKATATIALENALPIYSMELDISLPDELEFDVEDVEEAQELSDNGAKVTETSDGFKIRYSGENAPIYLSDIVSFEATSSETGEYDIEVSGNIISRNSDGTEKTLPVNVVTTGSITITGSKTASGSISGGGGGAGGGGYATGDLISPTQTPFPIFDESPSETESIRYADESQISDWAKNAVEVLSEKSIVSGSTDATGEVFRPKNNITRAEFTKLCVCAFTEVSDNADCNFTDVKASDWFYPYIATAQELGIVNGREDGSFGVNAQITRQEMSAIIYRIAQNGLISLSADNERTAYNDDAQISDWAKEAVYTMQESGVINGYGDGIFAPNDYATREMAAQVIYNALGGRAALGSASGNSSISSAALSTRSVSESFDGLMRLMENLDVVEDGTELNAAANIKRKDAAVYIVKMLTNAEYPVTDTAFADVKADVEESGYINAAVGLGLIDEGTNFYPDDDITLAELVKMLVKAINHTVVAESNGGDPEGYLYVAYKEEIITKKINASKGTVTTEEFFEMLKNTLAAITYDEVTGEKDESLFLTDKAHRIAKRVTITEVDKRNNQITATGKEETIQLYIPDNYQTQEFLDITGDIWYNADTEELIFIDISKKYEVRYDYLYGINGRYSEDMECYAKDIESINLYSDNKKYSLKDDAVIRYNGEVAEGLISPGNCFVRVLTESGIVKSVNMYKLEEGGIIISVTNSNISFRKGNATNTQVKELDQLSSIEALVDGVPHAWKKLPTNVLMDYYMDDDTAMFVVSTRKAEGAFKSYSDDELVLDSDTYNLNNGYGVVWYSNDGGSSYSKTPGNYYSTTVTALLDFGGRVRYVTGYKPTDNYVIGVITKREGTDFEVDSVTIYGNHAGTVGVKSFDLDLKKNTDVTAEELAKISNKDSLFKYYINGNRITRIEKIDWVKCNNDNKNNISSAANETLVELYGQDTITQMRNDPYVFLTGWTFGWDRRLYRLRFDAQTEAGVNYELLTHFDGTTFMAAYDQDGSFNPSMIGWGDYRNGWIDRMFVKVGYTKDNKDRTCPDIVYILSDPRWIRSHWDVFGVVEKVESLEDDNYMLSMIEPGDVHTDYIVKGDEIYGELDRQMPKKGDVAWIRAMGYYQEVYYNAEGIEITEDEAEELEEKGEEVTSETIYSANGYGYVQKIFDLPNEIGCYDNNIQITEVDNIYEINGNIMRYQDAATGQNLPIRSYSGSVYVVEGSGAYLMYDYEDFVNCNFEPKTYEEINTIKNNGFSDKLLIFSVAGGSYPKLILIMP